MSAPVFEMVWDCRYCGARKLLGLTHRHCPNCGSPQDPNARYFPADHEKVAVHQHQYFGADIQCRYCGAASSKQAHHCGRCGAALAEGTTVALQGDTGAGVAVMSPRVTAPPSKPLWKVLLPSVALLAVAVIVVLTLWKKDENLVVSAHRWQRTIVVERFAMVEESAWCDELPSAARDVSKRREQRGTQKVADGEDCHTRRVDHGDGTFKEERECSPRYKQEPVYDEKCSYKIAKWSQARRALAEGASDPPRWPSVSLARAGCSELGCEREGSRSEAYTVVFRDGTGEQYRCDFPETAWAKYSDGARYSGQLRALVGSLDCSSLKGPR